MLRLGSQCCARFEYAAGDVLGVRPDQPGGEPQRPVAVGGKVDVAFHVVPALEGADDLAGEVEFGQCLRAAGYVAEGFVDQFATVERLDPAGCLPEVVRSGLCDDCAAWLLSAAGLYCQRS
jgi:hypothetical protein